MNIAEDRIKKPCVGVYQLDKSSEFYIGCFRTREDLGNWSKADTIEKQKILENTSIRAAKVLAEIKARKAAKNT